MVWIGHVYEVMVIFETLPIPTSKELMTTTYVSDLSHFTTAIDYSWVKQKAHHYSKTIQ